MCSDWLCLANKIVVFAMIATDTNCPFAFINKIAMTIAFSELCRTFCGQPVFRVACLLSLPFRVRRQQRQKSEHRDDGHRQKRDTPQDE
jgi:hypothetical protein